MIYDDAIEYNKIKYIELVEEKLGYKILIYGSEQSYIMSFIISKDISDFVEMIRKRIL